MRHVHNIEYDNNLLSKIAPIFINEMKSSYPELLEASDLIISTLNMEEERFKNTLKNGLKYLKEEIDHLPKDGILSGIKAFKLYDTYGFPLDLTADILKERNLQLDHQGFETAMQEQKIKARDSLKKCLINFSLVYKTSFLNLISLILFHNFFFFHLVLGTQSKSFLKLNIQEISCQSNTNIFYAIYYFP